MQRGTAEADFVQEELANIQNMIAGAIGALVICMLLAVGVFVISGLIARWRASLYEARRARDGASQPDIWRTSGERVVPAADAEDEEERDER